MEDLKVLTGGEVLRASKERHGSDMRKRRKCSEGQGMDEDEEEVNGGGGGGKGEFKLDVLEK